MMAELRLVCDEMLFRLGRWLRAAGYDTLIIEQGAPDKEVVALARSEGRLLITRDQKLMEYRGAADFVVLLQGNSLHACVAELGQKLPIDWCYHPFSRCLRCNALLQAGEPELLVQVPDQSRQQVSQVFRCSGCSQLYWEGSHVRRMRRQLGQWQKIRDSAVD